MSNLDVFEKKHIDPSKMGRLESLLVHFNVPSKALDYYREHQIWIKRALFGLVLLVVVVSLYDSWRTKQIDQASLSLSQALEQSDSTIKDALQNVQKQYTGTNSGLWAEIELAHLDMKNKNFADAEKKYTQLKTKLDVGNPLFALTLYGTAQAQEAQKNYTDAYASYNQLKDIEAYRLTGYLGMARMYEVQNELDKALGIYGQFKTYLTSPEADKTTLALVDEKIARIKAKQ